MKELTYEESLTLILQVNNDLHDALLEIPQNKRHPIFLAEYDYADVIADKEGFYYPDGNKLIPQDKLSSKLHKHFAFYEKNIPIGVVITKTLEFTIEKPTLSIPGRFYHPGDTFGFEKFLSKTNEIYALPVFYVHAGARSSFSVTPLGNESLLAPVKTKYKTNILAPKNLNNHQPFFKVLYDNSSMDKKWKLQILYFSGAWVDSFHEKQYHCPLHKYFFNEYWKTSELARVRSTYDYLSSTIISTLKGFKPQPYIATLVRNFIFLILDGFPGYIPQTDDKQLPLKIIQDILIHVYKIKGNPCIVGPAYFRERQEIYFSLGYPSSMNFSRDYLPQQPTVRKIDLVNRLTSTFFNEFYQLYGKFDSNIGKLLPLIKLCFFHTHESIYENILPIKELLLHDKRFIVNNAPTELSSMSVFLRGLVSLKKISE